MRPLRKMLAILVAALVVPGWCTAAFSAEDAAGILAATGVKGGLVVHVGCGDGKLTAALRANESYIVHGLDADAASVEKARAHIRSLGIYGPVSVAQWTDPSRLPYAENLVNLLVAEDLGKVPMDEVLRVLAPLGVAYIGGKKTAKPWPKEIDEWSHWLHDASGDAVAHDVMVGPPRQLQWVAGPLWGKHHEGAGHSVLAMVSAGGREFDIEDETPPSVFNMSAKWFLVARDAYNGVVLWRRPLPQWFMSVWGDGGWGWGTGGPAKRLLVADRQRVYLPLGATAPLSALDAATGRELKTWDEVSGIAELVCDDGVLVVCSKKSTWAIRADAGDILWRGPGGHDVAVKDGRAFYLAGSDVLCMDLKTGRETWKVTPPPGSPPADGGKAGKAGKAAARPAGLEGPIRAGDGVILCGAHGRLLALSAETGRTLWTRPRATDLKSAFFVGGLVWTRGLGTLGESGTVGLDPKTGAARRSIPDDRVWNAGHHVRCYPPKATDRFILYNMRGVEFLDLASGDVSLTNWIRAICGQGMMPANGLLYAGPHACRCYSENILRGFYALAPARAKAPPETSAKAADRLVRGPAYGQPGSRPAGTDTAQDWPTYRHDSERSGTASSPVSRDLAPLWEAKVGGRPSPVTVAEGRLLVASPDEHRVLAFDAATGRPAWSFTAGGRVDGPPTIFQGLALFGSADGWVYCLRVGDGQLAWRFRAAPEDRRVGACGQLESAWPVHGSVLVSGGTAFVAAGRSSFLDGGMYLYGLEPATGRIVCETRLDGPWPGADVGTDNKEHQNPGYSMPGARADILVANDQRIYMGHIAFDRHMQKQDEPLSPNWPGSGKYWDDAIKYVCPNADPFKAGPELAPLSYYVVDFGRRVYSTSGLLDDSWHNRQYWAYGRVVGQYLVFRGNLAYAVRAYPNATRWTSFRSGEGYVLYAGEAFPSKKLPPVDLARWDVKYPVFEKGKEVPLALSDPEHTWHVRVPLRPVAMVLAGETLLLAGPPDLADSADALAAFEGRRGALLWAVSAANGAKLAEYPLQAPPVFEGMAAAGGRLYVCATDGRVVCFGAK